MPAVAELNNVSFRYGNEPIFTKIGFSVCPGDFIAMIGANGAGKSTLLRLLLGELSPEEGTIRLFGQDVHTFRGWPKIGYVPQNSFQSGADFPATVEEIVRANLYAQTGLFGLRKKNHHEQVLEALTLVGMQDYAKRLIGRLSGGQRQRVMLARCLVGKPQLMLLDEPTTGVDAPTVDALYQLLTRLNRETGLTVMMITHDISRASEYVSRVLCLEGGSLVELEKAQLAEELAHKHRHPGWQHPQVEGGV